MRHYKYCDIYDGQTIVATQLIEISDENAYKIMGYKVEPCKTQGMHKIIAESSDGKSMTLCDNVVYDNIRSEVDAYAKLLERRQLRLTDGTIAVTIKVMEKVTGRGYYTEIISDEYIPRDLFLPYEYKIGTRIAKLRKEKKITREELESIINAPPCSVQNWEKHITAPSATDMIKLSRVFGVNVNYILGLSDDSNKKGHIRVVISREARERRWRLSEITKTVTPSINPLIVDIIGHGTDAIVNFLGYKPHGNASQRTIAQKMQEELSRMDEDKIAAFAAKYGGSK